MNLPLITAKWGSQSGSADHPTTASRGFRLSASRNSSKTRQFAGLSSPMDGQSAKIDWFTLRSTSW